MVKRGVDALRSWGLQTELLSTMSRNGDGLGTREVARCFARAAETLLSVDAAPVSLLDACSAVAWLLERQDLWCGASTTVLGQQQEEGLGIASNLQGALDGVFKFARDLRVVMKRNSFLLGTTRLYLACLLSFGTASEGSLSPCASALQSVITRSLHRAARRHMPLQLAATVAARAFSLQFRLAAHPVAAGAAAAPPPVADGEREGPIVDSRDALQILKLAACGGILLVPVDDMLSELVDCATAALDRSRMGQRDAGGFYATVALDAVECICGVLAVAASRKAAASSRPTDAHFQEVARLVANVMVMTPADVVLPGIIQAPSL